MCPSKDISTFAHLFWDLNEEPHLLFGAVCVKLTCQDVTWKTLANCLNDVTSFSFKHCYGGVIVAYCERQLVFSNVKMKKLNNNESGAKFCSDCSVVPHCAMLLLLWVKNLLFGHSEFCLLRFISICCCHHSKFCLCNKWFLLSWSSKTAEAI